MKILILISIFFCFPGYGDVPKILCNRFDGAYEGTADFASRWNPFGLFDQTYDVNIASSSSEILVQIKERMDEGDERSERNRNISCTQFFDPRRSEMEILSSSILSKSGDYNDKLFPYTLDSIKLEYFVRNEDGFRFCIARGLFYLDGISHGSRWWWKLRRTGPRTKSFSDLSQECNALTATYRVHND